MNPAWGQRGAVFLAFACAAQGLLAEEEPTGIGRMIGKGGAMREALLTIGDFVFWLFFIGGAVLFLFGTMEVIGEWSKRKEEKTEWRRPLTKLGFGSLFAVSKWLWEVVARGFIPEEAGFVNPFDGRD